MKKHLPPLINMAPGHDSGYGPSGTHAYAVALYPKAEENDCDGSVAGLCALPLGCPSGTRSCLFFTRDSL